MVIPLPECDSGTVSYDIIAETMAAAVTFTFFWFITSKLKFSTDICIDNDVIITGTISI